MVKQCQGQQGHEGNSEHGVYSHKGFNLTATAVPGVYSQKGFNLTRSFILIICPTAASATGAKVLMFKGGTLILCSRLERCRKVDATELLQLLQFILLKVVH